MKKLLFVICLLIQTFTTYAQIRINRIDPTNRLVGMKDASLQLMVYGNDLHSTQVTTHDAGVQADSAVQMPNAHYLLAYLNLKGAKSGTITLSFTKGKKTKKVKCELKRREMSGDERMGFTNTDMLYMFTSNRSASGDTKNDQIKGMNNYVCDRAKPSLGYGGNLEGIRKHFDCFTNLGVTALWSTPASENNSPDTNDFSAYHGYVTTDYYKVDSRFGTNEEYHQLIDEAHQKGFKVVMDMIFNRYGFEHLQLKELPPDDWLNMPEWLEEGKETE